MSDEHEIDIDVRYEPDYDDTVHFDGKPILQWGRHPEHGNGWTLYYGTADDPEDFFTPGDLLDVDQAVKDAQHWLQLPQD